MTDPHSAVSQAATTAFDEKRIGKKDLKNATKLGGNPTMTALNKLLLDPNIRAAFWNHMNLEQDLPLPTFPATVLYGAVSEPIHQPGFSAIFLSDSADSALLNFCKALAKINHISVVLFDENAAVAGDKDIVKA